MTDTLDWNAKTIAEFRANEGRVGGVFEGAPMVLLHHRGRKSERDYVTPTSSIHGDLVGVVSERRKVLLTWENEGVEANILP